jgi:hypothetical protein
MLVLLKSRLNTVSDEAHVNIYIAWPPRQSQILACWWFDDKHVFDPDKTATGYNALRIFAQSFIA